MPRGKFIITKKNSKYSNADNPIGEASASGTGGTDNGAEINKKHPRIRMSKARRIKLRALIDSGMSYADALQNCLAETTNSGANRAQQAAPAVNRPVGQKRNRSGNENSPETVNKKPRAIKKTYRDITKATKIGILPLGFPTLVIDEKADNQMKVEILKLVATEEQKLDFPPKFVQVHILRNGWLLVPCHDAATAEWLASRELWALNQCKVVREKDFSTSNIITIYPKFCKDLTVSTIKGLISAQNNIPVDGWTELKSWDEGATTGVTFELTDDAFADVNCECFASKKKITRKVIL